MDLDRRTFVKRLAASLIGAVLITPTSGCQSAWEKKYECPQSMQAYIEDTKKIIDKYREGITNWIETNISEDERKVSPEDVIDLMLSGKVDILCGEGNKDEADAAGTGSGKEVVLRESWFSGEVGLLQQYLDSRDILDDNFNVDYDSIRQQILDHEEGIKAGYDKVYWDFFDIYVSLNNLGNILLHEFTHSAWARHGFNHRHKEELYIGGEETDVFYEYGNAVSHILIGILYDEVLPKVEEIKEELLDEYGETPRSDQSNLPSLESALETSIKQVRDYYFKQN